MAERLSLTRLAEIDAMLEQAPGRFTHSRDIICELRGEIDRLKGEIYELRSEITRLDDALTESGW